MPTFAFRGRSVHYTLHGRGPTLLLMHGAGGNGMNWSPEVRRLTGWRVAAIDLPGHGKSEDVRSLATITDYAALVLACADAIDAPIFAVAGQSLGGAVALQVALDAPERVSHLIVVACAPKIDVNPALLDALQTGDSSVYTILTRLSYARGTPPERLAQYEAHLRKVPPSVLWQAFAACSTFDVSARLPEIDLPTLILGANEDRMIPAQGSIDLHGTIRASSLYLFSTTGHMIHVEAPDETTRVFRAFLS